MFLLDTNVLIALSDPGHVHHSDCDNWFGANSIHGWSTCPIVENGFLRVVTQPAFRTNPVEIADALSLLQNMRTLPGFSFLPDDVSFADGEWVKSGLLRGPKQITDAFLLGLCRKHHRKLATTDQKLTSLIEPGENLIELI